MNNNFTYNKNEIIKIEHLKKSFDNLEILKDINITVKKGENIAIIGQSGIGKSVFIKCLVRLIQPDAGNIEIFGKDVLQQDSEGLKKIRQNIGFLFQGGALYDSMSVRENLEFPIARNLKTKDEQKINSLIYEVLDSVNLRTAIDKLPGELSGGMKKRAALARTLIMKPNIICYDEPTTGLDPITSKEISNLIVSVSKNYQTTSLIITHDINCVKITSNKIYVLKDGIFYKSGTYEDMKYSKDPWVKNFFN
ncbi:MAG: ATP-binding cassette domain-containing protein [Bacteroidales bacterium]